MNPTQFPHEAGAAVTAGTQPATATTKPRKAKAAKAPKVRKARTAPPELEALREKQKQERLALLQGIKDSMMLAKIQVLVAKLPLQRQAELRSWIEQMITSPEIPTGPING